MNQLKANFAVKSKYEAFYTAGKIQVSSDGLFMFCGCGNKVNVLEIATGKVQICIGEEQDEEITSFCVSPDDQYLVLATRHMLLRQWDWRNKKLIRTWKGIHFAPILCMGFDSTSTLLATGSADSTVKIWDIHRQYCTHNLKGHQGIISVVAFHPDISRLQIFTAGEDYKLRAWDLQTSRCTRDIAAHYSLVTGIAFSKDGQTVYTCGRDGVVVITNVDTLAVTRTVPVYEVLESLVLIPSTCDYPDINVDSGADHFITAGNKGTLRVWNAGTGKCVYTTDCVQARHSNTKQIDVVDGDKSEDTAQNIVQLVYTESVNRVTVVSYDQNIAILDVANLRLKKQFAGNNDEILDVKYFGEGGRYVIVATNSPHIKVFELDTWDCQILYGHTDIVLAVDVIPNTDMFVSCGKDNTVRLWKVNPECKQITCLAVGQGHTNAVGALALARAKGKFLVTGSEDCTLKLWNLPSNFDLSTTLELKAGVTEKAHDKTISSVVVAPNDRFIATGSMDKLAKLWDAKDLSLLGVMRGHKRGIWCVQFSPIDQILASSSGDGEVKLWSLTDFSCVRTFEGHDCAVLRVAFLMRGMQLLTTGTNGLVKLWTIKSNECVKTFDEHGDKVWSLAMGEADDTFVTGAADSSLIVWKDVTETEQEEARQKKETAILQEQELSNLIHEKKYLKAIGLAITLEQPFRLLNILKEIMSGDSGNDKLYDTLAKLRMDQIDALLRFSGQWNTNSRHCHEAQLVVSCLLRMYPPTRLKELANLKPSVEGLLPYSERHFGRLSRMVQQAMFLEYTWQCMKGMDTDKVMSREDMVQTSDVTMTTSDGTSAHSDLSVGRSLSEKTVNAFRNTDIKNTASKNISQKDETSSEESSESDDEDTATTQTNNIANKLDESDDHSDEESSESDLDVRSSRVVKGKTDISDTDSSTVQLKHIEKQDEESHTDTSEEERDNEDIEEDVPVISTEKVQKRLFKEQLSKKSTYPIQNIRFATPLGIEEKPRKRKITDKFTKVKDTSKRAESIFTIDRKGEKRDGVGGAKVSMEKKSRLAQKVTRADRLKKPKRLSR
ncbi:transducin beta-like protein 3 [Dreissena polymorpha]|uniref:U3 small nucleolar RNA-associated protein 13 C-terminal domain-containing protein n=1 Tax=Dreissena polymorpha TaxID=45954 RepID=A0A9D4RBY3_DREPO|nr:transducin beta-like protein 3 [Dreissena polymorpha]KAH3860700.1 hypothetical protein DPMN_023618 [Dreissena polymorpha]